MVFGSPWFCVGVGLLLVLPPVPMYFDRKVKYRSIENLEIARRNESWARVWRSILLMPTHWVELIRGYVGMWYLLEGLERILVDSARPAISSSSWMAPASALAAGIVALGILSFAFRNKEGAIAPIAFVTAAVLAIVPLTAAGLALILAFSTLLAFKSLASFFVALTIGVAGLGVLLGNGMLPSAMAAALATTPLLLGPLLHRELLLSVRQSHSKRGVRDDVAK
jgi:hypothetical protein